LKVWTPPTTTPNKQHQQQQYCCCYHAISNNQCNTQLLTTSGPTTLRLGTTIPGPRRKATKLGEATTTRKTQNTTPPTNKYTIAISLSLSLVLLSVLSAVCGFFFFFKWFLTLCLKLLVFEIFYQREL
jgi:hypothetical protein